MRAGLTGSDAYLEQWRRSDPEEVGNDLDAEVAAAASALEEAYPAERVRKIVQQDGFDRVG